MRFLQQRSAEGIAYDCPAAAGRESWRLRGRTVGWDAYPPRRKRGFDRARLFLKGQCRMGFPQHAARPRTLLGRSLPKGEWTGSGAAFLVRPRRIVERRMTRGDAMNSYCDIAASDGSGTMKAYLAMPAGKPKAGIVVIQEILGVNKDIRAMTDAWAANGYAAIAPDLFWRLKPGVELDADIPDEFQEGLDLLQKFNADKGVEDLAASIAALRSRGCAKVGVVGYCLGGRLAFLCAARTDSDATVGYYGVGLDNLLGERQNISKPLLLHIATRDKFSPPEAQAKVRAALKDNPLVTIYEYDADHAFARGSGSARVPALAQQADERTQAFFGDKLA